MKQSPRWLALVLLAVTTVACGDSGDAAPDAQSPARTDSGAPAPTDATPAPGPAVSAGELLGDGPPFSIVLLPDTQFYAASYPKYFDDQTRWIARERDNRKIAFVLHLGDIVDNTKTEPEWQRADASLSLLDNVVPYVL